jgi:hypothetical protein
MADDDWAQISAALHGWLQARRDGYYSPRGDLGDAYWAINGLLNEVLLAASERRLPWETDGDGEA